MKYALIIAAALAAGMLINSDWFRSIELPERDRRDSAVIFKELKTKDFYTFCIDGVAYWARPSTTAAMTEKRDKETGGIVRCEGDGIID